MQVLEGQKFTNFTEDNSFVNFIPWMINVAIH